MQAPDDAEWLVIFKIIDQPWQVRWFVHEEHVAEFEERLRDDWTPLQGFEAVWLADLLEQDSGEYGITMLRDRVAARGRPMQQVRLPDDTPGVAADGRPPVAP